MFLHLTTCNGQPCTFDTIKIGSASIVNDGVLMLFFPFSPRRCCVGIFISRAFLEVDCICCFSKENRILPVVSLVRTSLPCIQIVCDV